MVLSHRLESEPRAGLLSWASKISLFMTQVNYYTKDHFNGGGEREVLLLNLIKLNVFLLHYTHLQ